MFAGLLPKLHIILICCSISSFFVEGQPLPHVQPPAPAYGGPPAPPSAGYPPPPPRTIVIVDGVTAVNSTTNARVFTVYSNGTGAKNIHSQLGLWDAAPTCPPNPGHVIRDKQQKLWGWDPVGNFSCAVRPLMPPSPISVAATTPRWATAPRCTDPLDTTNYKRDIQGNLWGWEDLTSCAFRDAQGRPLTLPVTITGNASAPPPPPQPQVSAWLRAPICPRDAVSLKYDLDRNPWGWDLRNNRSCAVRPGTPFDLAPRCTQQPSRTNSKPDTSGALWGWESGASCAYKDAQGKPLALPAATPPPAPKAPDASGRRAQRRRLRGYNSAARDEI